MRVNRGVAVSVCQQVGYATADGWTDTKLLAKLPQIVRLRRSGELDVLLERSERRLTQEEESLLRALSADETDFAEIELVESDGDDSEPEETACELSVGDRVIVAGADGAYKALVKRVVSSEIVEVRDRPGNLWEEKVERCRRVERPPENEPRRSDAEPSDDPDDEKIRELERKIAAARRARSGGGRTEKIGKRSREQIAVDLLLRCREPRLLLEVADEVERLHVKQGRKANVVASRNVVERVAGYGRLFGLLKLEGNKVLYAGE